MPAFFFFLVVTIVKALKPCTNYKKKPMAVTKSCEFSFTGSFKGSLILFSSNESMQLSENGLLSKVSITIYSLVLVTKLEFKIYSLNFIY